MLGEYFHTQFCASFVVSLFHSFIMQGLKYLGPQCQTATLSSRKPTERLILKETGNIHKYTSLSTCTLQEKMYISEGVNNFDSISYSCLLMTLLHNVNINLPIQVSSYFRVHQFGE